MTRIGIVEWPDGLEPGQEAWRTIQRQVQAAKLDILVTNEMPFGAWVPTTARFDTAAAATWVGLHEHGLEALQFLDVPAIVSSRPVLAGDRLANEAFALENGQYRLLHHKHLFPAEPGWEEAAWFQPIQRGFAVHQINAVSLGILLCTELMFNEQARAMGQQGADLIAVPRATGKNYEPWRIAGAMASIVSGAFVVSSNRRGQASNAGPLFGGHGFAFAPGGAALENTSEASTLAVIDIDTSDSRSAKKEYPCYVDDQYIR